MFLLITSILTILLLYLYVTRKFNHWKNKNVPYIKPVPLFGNILKVFIMQTSIGKFLQDLYDKSKGPYIGFFAFDRPFLLIRDPVLIKSVLVKDFKHFSDRSILNDRVADRIGSNLLFNLENPTWKEARNEMVSAYLSVSKLKNMMSAVADKCDTLLKYINKQYLSNEPIEVRSMSLKHFTDVVALCALGVVSDSFNLDCSIFESTTKSFFNWNVNRALQMDSYFLAPLLARIFKMKFVETKPGLFYKDLIAKIIKERGESPYNRGDVIDVLLKIKKKNIWDDDMLTTQGLQFIFAAFETTGSTTSYALYELSLNPSLQNRLRTEIRRVFNECGEISYESIKNMEYLDMTIKESLRKYPVLPFINRRCTKTYQIPNTDVIIDKGTAVYISLSGLHFDPEYFPDPEKFDPDRFARENRNQRTDFVYMPFGEGPHNCIGSRFGFISSKLTIAKILLKYEVAPTRKTPTKINFNSKGFLLSPTHGLYLNFSPCQFN